MYNWYLQNIQRNTEVMLILHLDCESIKAKAEIMAMPKLYRKTIKTARLTLLTEMEEIYSQ